MAASSDPMNTNMITASKAMLNAPYRIDVRMVVTVAARMLSMSQLFVMFLEIASAPSIAPKKMANAVAGVRPDVFTMFGRNHADR